MRKYFKYAVIVMVFLFALFIVDMVCYSYFGTKPLLAKKEIINSYSTEVGVVYKTILSDIYYCDTTVDNYDDNGLNRQQKMIRYVIKKGDTFTCKSTISYYNNTDDNNDNADNNNDNINSYLDSDNPNDIEYMKYYVKDLYDNNLDSLYGINNKLNVLIYNFNSLYSIDKKYYDIYMFDYNDFTKDPVKLSIDGFDLVWRSTNYKSSPSGEILSFYYNCGYKDIWAGEQKYTNEDCENNKDTSGIYVFKVNSINDFEEIAYFPESNNDYINEYKDSYFRISEVLNDEEMIITYVVTNNKQEEPFKKVNYIWNFINNTIKETE